MMKRGAIIGAFIGGVIPVIVWVAYMFFGYMAGPETVMFWPSSIALLSLEHSPSMAWSVLVWLLSALINVAIYALLGLGASVVYRYAAKRRHTA
jgi:ethanolamine transporter EutH